MIASLSNIAGDAAEGMLVTMPKRYDQDPANQGIVDALKADKKDPSSPDYKQITVSRGSATVSFNRLGNRRAADRYNDPFHRFPAGKNRT